MATKFQRIAVTNDPELQAALEAVRPYVGDVPLATIVHDLAVRGAEVLAAEEEKRRESLAWLAWAFTTRPEGVLDWELLERVRDEAWGE